MELLTSMAMMVSMPVRFSCEILVPNCGRASMTMSSDRAASSTQNLTAGRMRDTSGISWRTNSGSPNLRSRFFCWRTMSRRTMTSTGMTASR